MQEDFKMNNQQNLQREKRDRYVLLCSTVNTKHKY